MNIKKFLKTINHLSDKTIEDYRQSLLQLNAKIKGDEPTKNDIVKFLKRYKTSTARRHAAVFKQYFEFINGKGTWPFPPNYPRTVQRNIPISVSPENILEMAKNAECDDDKLFVRTLFKLGCSTKSIRDLTKEDIDCTGIQVKTKSGIYHGVPIAKKFLNELQTYSENKKGKIFPKTYHYYYKLIKKLGASIGHPEITPQIIHNSRIEYFLRNNMSIPMVRRIIDQVTVNVEKIYSEMDKKITEEDINNALETIDSKLPF
jgi:integrase